MINEEKIKQLENTVNELIKSINALEDVNTIPLNVENAFRRRNIGISNVTATSQTQAVQENGASVYNVAKPPTGFMTITDINGEARDVPYYTV